MKGTEVKKEHLHEMLAQFKGQKGAMIPILQRIQDEFGYLPKDVMLETSKIIGIPISQLYGVATFYAQFRLSRRGKHMIKVCDGTACHVRGAPKIVEGVVNALGVKPGESDAEYKYSLEIVYCLGSCGLAPMSVVDDVVYGQTETEKLVDQLKKLD
jgi:NADH-quinone oxidoreductase subunit E